MIPLRTYARYLIKNTTRAIYKVGLKHISKTRKSVLLFQVYKKGGFPLAGC
jgi:hypothetical protein